MRVSALAPAFAAIAAFASAFLLEVTAWPEMVAAAWHVAHGWTLYERVIEPYTPGLILLTAGAGRLVGFSPALFRVLAGLPLALCAFLAVSSVRSPRERLIRALLAPLLLALWAVYFEGPALWPDPFLAPLLLAAGLTLRSWSLTFENRFLYRAGLLFGLAILFKQTSAWALLAATLWCLASGRRDSVATSARLFLTACAPYAAFAAAWAFAGRTFAHLRWTLFIPLHGHAAEFGNAPDAQDLAEVIGPALVLPALALLARTLPRRPRTSPLAWIAVGAAFMAFPRWGLLHLSGATGLLVVLSLESIRALRITVAHANRLRSRRRLLLAAGGAGLLLSHLGLALFGAGALASDALGKGVRYWDDSQLNLMSAEVSRRVPPGGSFLNYFAAGDNLYPRTGTYAPGGLYVNTMFWFFLNKDDLDARMVDALVQPPETLVLFAEPKEEWAAPARKTRLYRFINGQTDVVSRVDGETVWRVVRPPRQ